MNVAQNLLQIWLLIIKELLVKSLLLGALLYNTSRITKGDSAYVQTNYISM